MNQPLLFSPIAIRSITLKNRIVLSPLCMYVAKQGVANEFHSSHLTAFARGGAGLVFTEATAVSPEGRISHGCCGLWNDAQVDAYRPITEAITSLGSVPAIQIAHAGRKASVREPWRGSAPLDASDKDLQQPPWGVIGPTADPVGPGWPSPTAMNEQDIDGIVGKFSEAANRALDAGFKVLEVHAAHGYLLHSFLSPLANTRNDHYGGDLKGRMRFALEVATAVRIAWPEELPLFFRISAIDTQSGGWTIEDSVVLARELKALGVDVVDCSSGGIAGAPAFRAGDDGQPLKSNGERPPGFQVPFADRVRRDADIATMAVGVITTGPQAEEILRSGHADLVALGRELMYDPFWPLHAAGVLGCDPECEMWPPSYAWAIKRRATIRADNASA